MRCDERCSWRTGCGPRRGCLIQVAVRVMVFVRREQPLPIRARTVRECPHSRSLPEESCDGRGCDVCRRPPQRPGDFQHIEVWSPPFPGPRRSSRAASRGPSLSAPRRVGRVIRRTPASRNATKRLEAVSPFAGNNRTERIKRSSFDNDTRRIPSTLNNSAARSCPSARSTLVHAVFCVRKAPTMTSNGVSAGHQCCASHAS